MRLLLVLGALSLSLVGCRRATHVGGATLGSLRIQGGYAFQPVTRDEAAVYFEVVNSAEAADTLIGAACEIAASATIHGLGAGTPREMAALERLPIQAHDSLRLEPGRLHLMLMDLDRIPQAGDYLNLTLRFARAGTVTFAVPVRPYGR
ncbi:MAG: copper chaperone PCu(A)C [Gemmatimonadales bacterium]